MPSIFFYNIKCLFYPLVDQQQLQIQKHGKTNKVMHSFPVQSPNITVEPLSSDPKNDDFLAFRLVNSTTKKELDRYRTDDIVQMRHFMTSLGRSGFGIFTSKPPPTIEAEEALWAGIAPPKAHKSAQEYEELLASLPTEFYFSKKPSGIIATISAGAMPTPLAKPLPLYNPQTPLAPSKRRPWHDTFRPPLGPAVYVPISMGYGEEVGLQIGQQAVWDPVLKACVVLDHNTKQYINKDLRRPFKYPKKVVQSVIRFGDMRPAPNFKYKYSICNDPHVIKAAADRANLKIKPHGFILDASGVKGMRGPNGRSAAPGVDGHPGDCGKSKGADGRAGEYGAPGNPGTEGIDGKPGTNASNVTLFLEGDSSKLKVSGSYTFDTNLGGPDNEEVLLVNCRGGDGGKGGDGGYGGVGGDGGDGGDGAPGKKGWDNPGGGRGGDGGPGGDGGTGGYGGPGGCGGIGGKGGNAGAGGTCIICAADPKLLILLEVDALNGKAGKGGTGGKGGAGGKGGYGGYGGIGGRGGTGYIVQTTREYRGSYYVEKQTTISMPGNDGPDGRRGNPGSNGRLGRDGNSGSDGKQALVGGIAWVVYSKEGNVLQQAGTRYDIEVKNFEIVDENNDGVFEPNERIAVSEVLVMNVGGLTLPAGAEVTIQKTKTNTMNFEPIRYKLQEVLPGKSFKVPITFYGRINDQPPPLTADLLETRADFESRVELLGRSFSNSFHSKQLRVQYPVKLKQLQCNENVGRSEVTIISIQIENISTKPYGACQGSAGKVGVQVHMDARLIPVAYGSYKDEKLPYIVSYDPIKRDSVYIEVSCIPPKQTLTMYIAVQIDSEAELFDRCQWQADLCLRGKVIEYKFEKIRISPIYVQREPPGDILMVTGPDISLAAFNLWQRMFHILGVTVDFWDTTRHHGFSEDCSTKSCHSITWVGRYHGRLILYPYCHLPFLRGSHIIHHFHGEQAERPDLNSGMVLFMRPSPLRRVKLESRFQDRGDVPILQHLASIDESLPLPKEGYGGKHMTSPTSDKSFLKWEQQTLQQKEKENPSHGVSVFRRQSSIESVGSFKYSYGEVDLRRCPLKRSCKFVAVDGAGGGIAQIGGDDMNVSPSNLNQVPLASNFGQAFLFTLYGLPMSTKLSLIKGTGDITQISFSLPNGLLLSLAQISVICLSYEMADEVLGCPKTLLRTNEVLADITANKSAYVSKAELMLQLIDLVDKELQERKNRVDNPIVTQATKEAKKLLGQIQQAIRESGRRSSKAKQPVLPGLMILQDTLHAHRSHQHMVKDDRWNLVTS